LTAERFIVNVGILLAMRSVTMQSRTVKKEFKRECSLTCVSVDHVVAPPTPVTDIFIARVSHPNLSRKSLVMKLACDPESKSAAELLGTVLAYHKNNDSGGKQDTTV